MNYMHDTRDLVHDIGSYDMTCMLLHLVVWGPLTSCTAERVTFLLSVCS